MTINPKSNLNHTLKSPQLNSPGIIYVFHYKQQILAYKIYLKILNIGMRNELNWELHQYPID